MITFEEVKEIFKKSIDTTDTMNQAIKNFIQSIYLKGYNDALKHAHCPHCRAKMEDEELTREEVIEILKELWRYERTGKYTDSQIREALEFVIKALEQESCIMYEPKMRACKDCNHYGKLSLDCSRCDDDCSMFEDNTHYDEFGFIDPFSFNKGNTK